MAESVASRLIAARGNRCTATILSFLEQEIYPQVGVSAEQQRRIRRVVLDTVNDFKDLAIDVTKSDTGIVNDIWVDHLGALSRKMDQIMEAVGGEAQ